jgi:hypothetical protein
MSSEHCYGWTCTKQGLNEAHSTVTLVEEHLTPDRVVAAACLSSVGVGAGCVHTVPQDQRRQEAECPGVGITCCLPGVAQHLAPTGLSRNIIWVQRGWVSVLASAPSLATQLALAATTAAPATCTSSTHDMNQQYQQRLFHDHSEFNTS